jgi:hypothetical protein
MYMNNNFQPVGKCGMPKNGGCKCEKDLKNL